MADELVARLSARYPGLNVAGAISPPLLPTGALENESTILAINDAKPDIVWVGLSTPKQDWWMANHRPLLDAPVLIGVGAANFQIAGDRIHKIDPATGEVLSTIPAPGGGRDSGLAWGEGTLWVGQYRDRKIHEIDPDTGAILRTIESNRFVTLWQVRPRSPPAGTRTARRYSPERRSCRP